MVFSSIYQQNSSVSLFSSFILTGPADPLFTETFFAATFTGDHFRNLVQQGKNNHDNAGDYRYGRCFYFRIIVDPAHYYRKQTDTEGGVFHAHNQTLFKIYGFIELV